MVGVMAQHQTYSVLLLRKVGVLNDGFEYLAEDLPYLGDEIELTPPADFRTSTVVRAVVTGIEQDKHSPVRAREL